MAYSSTVVGREFWLPSDFLAHDHILMDKHNSDLASFPTDFPYEFGSPVESVVGSTESESDEDDLIAGLTRHFPRSTLQPHHKINISLTTQNLEKPWMLSGSPQSTLSAVGSWSNRSPVSSNGSPNGPSQAPSPPTSPYGANKNSWDLIYAAAGQVAKLKMNGDWSSNARGPVIPPRNLTPAYPSPVVKPHNTGIYLNNCFPHTLSQPNHSSVWGRDAKEVWPSQQQNQISRQNKGGDSFGQTGKTVRPSGVLSQSAWPPLQVEHQHRPNPQQQRGGSAARGAFVGGSDTGVKRECAGTGVFLPRRYGTFTDICKRPGGSTAPLPTKVVQALNNNMADMSHHVQPQIKAQGRVSGGSIPDYNALMARRNALLAQQRRSIRSEGAAMNPEIRLPQEWTY